MKEFLIGKKIKLFYTIIFCPSPCKYGNYLHLGWVKAVNERSHANGLNNMH